MGKTVSLSKDEFCRKVVDISQPGQQWIFNGRKPAVVDFFASWCGPCRALAPLIDRFAADYSGRVDIYKVDVDAESELAEAFGVRSVPTLLFARPGSRPHVITGLQPADTLKSMIEKLLEPAPAAMG